jgi:hypothetical protein
VTEAKPPCLRCGGVGIMTAARAAEIAAAIPVETSLCAAGAVYRARLERCASCTSLREGVLCAWCGCFVQFRARPKAAYCPDPAEDKWKGV